MVLDKLTKDLPQQFQGKENINALCSVFDRQLVEILAVFASLRDDRSLDTAVGKQLDMIGDIVGLSRIDGALLCGKKTDFNLLDDDRYRLYLKYKAYKNANNCTYEDVVNQLATILGENNFSYSEDMSYPATVLVSVNLNNNGAVSLADIPEIAPAGVNTLYENKFSATINVSYETHIVSRAPVMYCGTFDCGTRPRK